MKEWAKICAELNTSLVIVKWRGLLNYCIKSPKTSGASRRFVVDLSLDGLQRDKSFSIGWQLIVVTSIWSRVFRCRCRRCSFRDCCCCSCACNGRCSTNSSRRRSFLLVGDCCSWTVGWWAQSIRHSIWMQLFQWFRLSIDCYNCSIHTRARSISPLLSRVCSSRISADELWMIDKSRSCSLVIRSSETMKELTFSIKSLWLNDMNTRRNSTIKFESHRPSLKQ